MKYSRRMHNKRKNYTKNRDVSVAYSEVKNSNLFDTEWYLEKNPDVASAGLDPLLHYLEHGWQESRDPNLLFDTDWYLDRYQDVRDAGFNPLLHYVRHGAIETRDTSPKFRPSTFQDPAVPRGAHYQAAAINYLRKIERSNEQPSQRVLGSERILIVAELSIEQCRKYRVEQKAELLRLHGLEATVVNWRDSDRCEAALVTHSMVIFYRVPAADSVLRCITKAKKMGVPTLWEVDDLIFDPNAYMANAGLRAVPPHVQREVLTGVQFYNTAMLACDEAIASTRTLAKAMHEAGMKIVHIVENALDEDTIKAADRAIRAVRKVKMTGDIVRIVYGSGTNTHDKDFLQAAGAIRKCLEIHPNVKLRIIGDLNLPKEFLGLKGKIELFEKTSYHNYLKLMAECDMAIAPLEQNLFNDAKSNIKYIEASMIELPSVCSSVAEFSGIIKHQNNGMLAKDANTWFESLNALIVNRELRESLATAAKATVLSRYSKENIEKTQIAPIVSRLTGGRNLTPEPRASLRILAVNVFYEPRSFGGATIVAEQMANMLNARDDTEVAVFTTAPHGATEPYQLLNYQAGSIPVFAVCLPEISDPTASFDTERTVESFRDVVRLTKPDVVHFHSIQGLGARLLEVCEEEDVPSVVTLHDAWWICGQQFMIKGDGSYCFQTRIDLNRCNTCVSDPGLNLYRQYRLRDMLDRADLLLTPSGFFRGIYAANDFPPERLKVNRNGVARPTNFQRSASQKLRFGFVGGNAAIKGAKLIQKIFADLNRSDYELVIIDNLLSLGFASINPDDWKISGDLRVLPAYDQTNMDSFYSQIDVLLFPTQWKESFGLTVREALIRDIWVVTTDAGGVVEDVVDGENGQIIPLLDDGRALKAAVLRALDNADEMKSHVNPHKAKIIDHGQQAAELYEYLSAVSQAKLKSRAPVEAGTERRKIVT